MAKKKNKRKSKAKPIFRAKLRSNHKRFPSNPNRAKTA